jgi:hypothetical protein
LIGDTGVIHTKSFSGARGIGVADARDFDDGHLRVA